MPSVNWTSSSLQYAGVQRVYVRQRWNQAWSLNTRIWCEQATWSLLPSTPTARFILDYGQVIPHGQTSVVVQPKLNLVGWYVKVEFDCADGTRTWYGYIDEVGDAQGGLVGNYPTGRLTYVAYGMSQVLRHIYLTDAKWYDEVGSTTRTAEAAIDFNAGGKPNRYDNADTKAFLPNLPPDINASYLEPDYWSTREIVEYLEEYHQTDAIPWTIDNPSLLADWDSPATSTEGKTVLDILTELINQRRMLQVSESIDEATTPDTIKLTIHSLSDTAITGTANGVSVSHPANTDLLTVTCYGAQDTQAVVQFSASQQVQQVICKGDRRRVGVSFQVDRDAGNTGLIEGWDIFQEDDYNDGATAEAGYGAMTDDEKRAANHTARSVQELEDVYRSLVLNPYWDGYQADLGLVKELVFVVDGASDFTSPSNRYYPFPNSTLVDSVIPIKESADIGNWPESYPDEDLTTWRKPYGVFAVPLPTLLDYRPAERIADGLNHTYSVRIGVGKDSRGITMDVNGEAQHIIASRDFVNADVDIDVGNRIDYSQAIFTVGLIEDRFCEARYPEDDDITNVDVKRQMVVYAGDAYRKVSVPEGTVVDTSIVGLPVKTAFSVEEDDSDALEFLAKIAYGYYGVSRKVMRLRSSRPSAIPQVGQILTYLNPATVHSESIRTIVSEITVTTPLAEGTVPQAAQFDLVTARGEVDPLAFSPQLRSVQP